METPPEGVDFKVSDSQSLPMDPGQFVDFVLPDPDDAEKELVFFAKVKSAKDGVFLTTQPQKDGNNMPYPGLPYEVTIRIPKDAFVWSFPTEITNVMGDTFVLNMPAPDAVLREQRRGHVRASVNIKVQASVHMASRYYAEHTIEIVDLSGGGCQMVGEKPFIANAILRLKIPLPTKVIEVHGKVVRANPFPQGTNKRTYISGFAFTKISEADRELMIKFIFDKMREDIKQGKVV
jgi:c-di-GMP-binding flagellar brake protein YcgR